jgi:hypothetical protein
MAVACLGALFLFVEVRKGHRFELDVSGKRLVRGAHQGVVDVVAEAVEVSKPDQFPLALLGAVYRMGGQAVLLQPGNESGVLLVAHVVARRLPVGHSHFHPGGVKDAGRVSQELGVCLIGATVVEQVELDHFHSLEFQIEERTSDPASVPAEIAEQRAETRHFRISVTGGPIIPPVDPWAQSFLQGSLAATTACRIFPNLAEKSFAAVGRHVSWSARDVCEAGAQLFWIKGSATGNGKQKGGQHKRRGQRVHFIEQLPVVRSPVVLFYALAEKIST